MSLKICLSHFVAQVFAGCVTLMLGRKPALGHAMRSAGLRLALFLCCATGILLFDATAAQAQGIVAHSPVTNSVGVNVTARCVRVCDEIEGAHVWDVMGRGVNSRVIIDLNQAWGSSQSCTNCGKCVQVCPTGALFDKGATVAEMEKQHNFLRWILDGREKNVWSYSNGK